MKFVPSLVPSFLLIIKSNKEHVIRQRNQQNLNWKGKFIPLILIDKQWCQRFYTSACPICLPYLCYCLWTYKWNFLLNHEWREHKACKLIYRVYHEDSMLFPFHVSFFASSLLLFCFSFNFVDLKLLP
jgi:hypothetical protein